MTILKARQVLSGLMKKGFVQSQGHHAFLILYINGKKTSIYTKVSHGSNEINEYLINQMSLQVRLEKRQFIDLVNCPLSLEDYLRELEAKGFCFA